MTRRDNSSRMPWWAWAVFGVPVIGGTLTLAGIALGLAASHGRWLFFWIMLGVTIYIPAALISSRRYWRKHPDDLERRRSEVWRVNTMWLPNPPATRPRRRSRP